jgi:predicted peroxiredoxin
MFKTLSIALLATALLFAAAASSADDQKTIFYNVTTDESWPAGMALGQAGKALDNGYKVVIFLNVRAVFIAAKGFTTDTNGAAGKSLRQQLEAAMGKGAQVIVCPMCLSKAGLSMDDMIDGVIKGGPDTTLKAMTADDTVVISY